MQGILFTPDNHKAIRDKLKSQTRRLDHLKEINQTPDGWRLYDWKYKLTPAISGAFLFTSTISCEENVVKPRYRVEEIVYIKEALKSDRLRQVQYIDGTYPINPLTKSWYPWLWTKDTLSPMFMPAWAARTFIKITDVRPERLRQITDDDCQAEGCQYPQWRGSYTSWQGAYKALWDSINRAYPFDSNPWVWRICFDLIEGEVK